MPDDQPTPYQQFMPQDQSQMSADDMARRLRLMQMFYGRGGFGGAQAQNNTMQQLLGQGGMQQNPLMGGGQPFGQALLQNPQVLQWLMQQYNGGMGSYPQGGGGVDLLQALGLGMGAR